MRNISKKHLKMIRKSNEFMSSNPIICGANNNEISLKCDQTKEISNIQITIGPSINGDCPFCKGNGYIRFMQSAACINGPSIRDRDILVGCTWCHGTGKAKEHEQKELYLGEKDNWNYFNRRMYED